MPDDNTVWFPLVLPQNGEAVMSLASHPVKVGFLQHRGSDRRVRRLKLDPPVLINPAEVVVHDDYAIVAGVRYEWDDVS